MVRITGMMPMKSWSGIVLALVLMSGCKADPQAAKELEGTGITTKGATAGVEANSIPPVRLQVSIDGRPTEFTIPASEPASLERESWAKQICIFVATRTADEAELQIALLPKAPTHASIDLAVFKKQIAFTRAIKPGVPITLRPAEAFPGDGLGKSAPLEVRITWIQ
jgi:hypothetical protein